MMGEKVTPFKVGDTDGGDRTGEEDDSLRLGVETVGRV